MKTLYFAYGSNMDTDQMANRCFGAQLVGVGKIIGWKFVINSRGVATIIQSISHEVYGVAWEIDKNHEQALDGYEGVKWGTYAKVDKEIIMGSGDALTALVYVAGDTEPGRPRSGYMSKIISAAMKHDLPDTYIEELRSWP